MKLGLSGKLLFLTLSFVLLAEVFIYVPSIANFRRNWMMDKLTAARTAALVLDASPTGMLSPELTSELLKSIGVTAIAVKKGDMRQLIADIDPPPMANYTTDTRNMGFFTNIRDSFDTLLNYEPRIFLLHGPAPKNEMFIEVLLSEEPLKSAMWEFSRNIIWLSLLISSFTALLVYLALHKLLVRPMRGLNAAMQLFSQNPELKENIIANSNRNDEIGLAESELQQMQQQINTALREKNRLAQLGLAVAKINHDLRNMLTTVHIFSDRLVDSSDVMVQNFAPKMISALDRAVLLCNETLTFGQAKPQQLNKSHFALYNLIDDVESNLGEIKPSFNKQISQGLVIYADYEQLFRLFTNLCRNSIEAMKEVGDTIDISSDTHTTQIVIDVKDNGSGLPVKAKQHLFEAFRGNVRSGGTGLGLAIAHEIIVAHGGTITLMESEVGAFFRVILPKIYDKAKQ